MLGLLAMARCPTHDASSAQPGINGLLDVARRAYTETIEDIHALVEQLAKTHSLPLQTQYHLNRGFYISLKDAPEAMDLPAVFIQVSRTKKTLTFTTRDLV